MCYMTGFVIIKRLDLNQEIQEQQGEIECYV